MEINDSENYDLLAKKILEEAEEILNSLGFNDSSDLEPEKAEKILWKTAIKYKNSLIKPEVFSEICQIYEGLPIHFNLSEEAQSLISCGCDIDYYLFANPDTSELEITNKNVLELVDWYENVWYQNLE